MDPVLKTSLRQVVVIKKRTNTNQYGEPFIDSVVVMGRFETSRSRVWGTEGDEITLEGVVFIDGPDLRAGEVEPGDTVVHPDTLKERAIRLIEPLYDLDNPAIDHWELSF